MNRWQMTECERETVVFHSKLIEPKIGTHQWPIVYHRRYNIGFFGLERLHPFDAGKWGKVFDLLKTSQMLSEQTIVNAIEAQTSDLEVVHTKKYLNSLRSSLTVAQIMEVPCVALLPNSIVNRYALTAFRYHTGGTIMAAQLAIERKWAINIGGGFHHCSKDRGGGFCAYADITLAIEFLFLQKLIQRAMIVDLDAHQGNGHERDFAGDDRVYIFDMFNYEIYPGDYDAKSSIRKSIPIRSGTSDRLYLKELSTNLKAALIEFEPDILLYNAGTDSLVGDPLGALSISTDGIIERDRIVFSLARDHSVPIVMVTSGGYQRSNAAVIARSILNLRDTGLISLPQVES